MSAVDRKSPRRRRAKSDKKGRERSRSPSKEKGKKMSREEMAKTPCTYFAKGNCKRGDKCYFKHDATAAPAKEKNKPRPNSPSAKKDAKKGAVCVRHVCIAKSMPGSLPSPSMANPKKRLKVRFNLKPKIIQIQAVGEQCKLIEKPRQYEKVYPDADDIPKPSKKEQHLAQVHARRHVSCRKLFAFSTARSLRVNSIAWSHHSLASTAEKFVDQSCCARCQLITASHHQLQRQFRVAARCHGWLIQVVNRT